MSVHRSNAGASDVATDDYYRINVVLPALDEILGTRHFDSEFNSGGLLACLIVICYSRKPPQLRGRVSSQPRSSTYLLVLNGRSDSESFTCAEFTV